MRALREIFKNGLSCLCFGLALGQFSLGREKRSVIGIVDYQQPVLVLFFKPFFKQEHLVAFLIFSTGDIAFVNNVVIAVSKPVDAACMNPEYRHVLGLDAYLM